MSESKLQMVIPVLTKFPSNVAPTRDVIKKLQVELNANAQGIRSSAGGPLGLLSLTMAPAQYLALNNNVAFVPPVNPGDIPIHLPGATTQFEIAETNRLYRVQTAIFEKYHDTDLALKTLLIAACPDIYIEALKQEHVGYGARTCLDFLTHLWTNYAKIEPSHLWENEKRMKAAWHPTDPIEKLFSQLKTTFEFATAGNAGITEINAVRIGYQIIMDSGLFKLELKEWRAKPEADWTLANFNIFFKAANCDRLATTTDGGFHSANVSTTFISEPSTHIIAAAPSAEFAAMKIKIAQLEKIIKANTKQPTASVPTSTSSATTSYCWTHGTTKNLIHTGFSCKRRAEGHREEATEDNKMGGSTKVWTSPVTPRK